MKSLKIPNDDDDNDDVSFVLDQHTFSSNDTPMVNVLLHSGTLSWFWAKQALVLLLNAASLAEKLQIPISLFLLIVSNTRFTALEKSTNTISANIFFQHTCPSTWYIGIVICFVYLLKYMAYNYWPYSVLYTPMSILYNY